MKHQPISEEEAIANFVLEDPTYPAEAYHFYRNAFAYIETLPDLKKEDGRKGFSGRQIADAFCNFALDEFGPMASFTLKRWNIMSTSDFGELTANLIKIGLLIQEKSDKMDDFDNLFDLHSELTKPFE